MVRDRRKPSDPVTFEPPRPATLMSPDGTWSRPCQIREISETGAQLGVAGATPLSTMTEFFLLLTSTGSVSRRCALAARHGEDMEVVFLKPRAPAPMMLSFDMIAPEPDRPPEPAGRDGDFPVSLAAPPTALSHPAAFPA